MSEKYCPICKETNVFQLTERKGQTMCGDCADTYDRLKKARVEKSLNDLLEMEE